MTKAVTLTILVALLVAFNACTSDDSKKLSDDEIALFEKKLANGATPKEACDELEVLCNSTGFGCKAHAAFCDIPTKAYICQQLAAACIDYPAACDVYNDHCKTPVSDTGVPKDAGIDDSLTQDSAIDAEPPVKDAGPQPVDFMKMDVSMPEAAVDDTWPVSADASVKVDTIND